MNIVEKVSITLRQRPALGLLGAMGLAVLVGAGMRFALPPAPTTTGQANQTDAVVDETGLVAFESPMVSVSWRLQSATPKTLLASTNGSSRADSIVAGRADPFSPITQSPPVQAPPPVAAAATTPTSGIQAGPGSPSNVAPLPIAPIPTTGQLPALPTSPNPVAVPSTPAPLAALPSPNQLLGNTPTAASPLQVELTGVAQVGDRVALIVREAGSGTSRYTFAGDYLANGQILIKHIDVSAQEPQVVLEYNGREYTRMVGSSAVAALPQ
jgi:hypothetical protein